MKLPGFRPEVLEAEILPELALHNGLEALGLQNQLTPEQGQALAAMESLKQLELQECETAVAVLPYGLTALTVNNKRLAPGPVLAAPELGSKQRPLRRLCLQGPGCAAVLSALLPVSQGLTSLVVPDTVMSPASWASISKLVQLDQLHCRPWQGMAQQLADLKRLLKLSISISIRVSDAAHSWRPSVPGDQAATGSSASDELCVVEEQAVQLAGLQQLREISLVGKGEAGEYWGKQARRVAALVQAMSAAGRCPLVCARPLPYRYYGR